jgi:hypothetical protein
MISKLMVRSVQIVHLSCVKTNTISKQTQWASTWSSSPEVPLGASEIISEPIIRLTQTVHLSCTDTNTVSKWTKSRFHTAHVTEEFYYVRPKWFVSLWYVWRKPCTYLASRLALSPNGPSRPSTWATSPRTTNGCVQNDLWAYGHLDQTMQLSCTDTNTIFKQNEQRLHMTHVP